MEQPILSTEVTAMSQGVQNSEGQEEQARCPCCHTQLQGRHLATQGQPGGEREVCGIRGLEAGMWYLCAVLGADQPGINQGCSCDEYPQARAVLGR